MPKWPYSQDGPYLSPRPSPAVTPKHAAPQDSSYYKCEACAAGLHGDLNNVKYGKQHTDSLVHWLECWAFDLEVPGSDLFLVAL